MRAILTVVVLGLAVPARAQLPPLPEGARTNWTVEAPEQLVAWQAFDPSRQLEKLPPFLRFVTIGELADDGIPWAKTFLAEHPLATAWGVSFLEVVRAGVFSIDDRTPLWDEGGAVALWMARVAYREGSTRSDLGPPFLTMDFWIPDPDFVDFITDRGHYASVGRVSLVGEAESSLEVSVVAPGVSIRGSCRPEVRINTRGSSGYQVLFPPATSMSSRVVRVAFAGHQVRSCRSAPDWEIEGEHPLASSLSISGLEFQSGYHLVGAAYEPIHR